MVDDARAVLRIFSGPEGRAVRLGEVLEWLAERDELVITDAVDAVLNALANAPCELYWHQPGKGAKLIAVDREWFNTKSGAPGTQPVQGRRVLSRGIEGGAQVHPMAGSLGRGMVGFCAWLKRWRVTTSAAGPERGAWWGVVLRESDARRLWGWGEVVQAEAPRVPSVAPAVVIAEADVVDWADVRLNHKVLFPAGLATWPASFCIIAWQFHMRGGRKPSRGPETIKQMAAALGVGQTTVADMLKRGEEGARSRQIVLGGKKVA